MADAVVLDIEGTTSSLTYVRDHLFPYSAAAVGEWVERMDPEVTAVLDEVRRDAGLPDGDPGVVARVLREWIRDDVKVSSLKSLQGMIWAEGFARGELRGHVYGDVPPALRRWTRAGIRVYIYSSGSTQAQRAWFGHSDHGDLTGYLSGYFDTRNAGPKRDVASYHEIGHALGGRPDSLVFLSDVTAELDAAATAGWRTICLHRTDGPPAGHRAVSSFSQIALTAEDVESGNPAF